MEFMKNTTLMLFVFGNVLEGQGSEEKTNEPPRISWTMNPEIPGSSNRTANSLTLGDAVASESLDPEHIDVLQHLDLDTASWMRLKYVFVKTCTYACLHFVSMEIKTERTSFKNKLIVVWSIIYIFGRFMSCI
jgi:hypothetical protein